MFDCSFNEWHCLHNMWSFANGRLLLKLSTPMRSSQKQVIETPWLSILTVGASIGWASHKYETKCTLSQHDV